MPAEPPVSTVSFPLLTETVTQVLRQCGLTCPQFQDVLRKHRRRTKTFRYYPVTLHLRCLQSPGRGQVHLRVLVRNSEKWRKVRLEAIQHQLDLQSLTETMNLRFRVPSIIAWGGSPLVWDVSAYEDGFQLPWRNYLTDRLVHHLERAASIVDANLALQGVVLGRVPQFSESLLHDTFNLLFERGREIGFLSGRAGRRIAESWSSWTDSGRRGRYVLTHGDLNPSNILFTNNHIFLLDWDFLRYSRPADSFARLWMFLSGERRFQERLESCLRDVFSDSASWTEFKAYAALHALQQSEHEFRVAQVAAGGVNALRLRHRKGASAVERFLSALQHL